MPIPNTRLCASGVVQLRPDGVTTVPWIGDFYAVNAIPTFLKISRISGSVNNCTSSLLWNGITLQSITSAKYNLLTDNGRYLFFSLSANSVNNVFSNSGVLSMDVTNATANPSAVGIEIYGLYLV